MNRAGSSLRPFLRAALLACASVSLLSGAALAGSAQIQVRAQVRPESFTIGDPVELEVAFTHSPGVEISPDFSATQFAHWEIRRIREEAPRRTRDGDLSKTFLLEMAAWSVTVTATPRMPFRAQSGSAWTKTIMVSPQKVKVESVLAKAEDTSDIRPVKGAIGYRSLLPYAIAALLALAGLGAYLLWRRRRRRAILAAAPARPPDEAAREALKALLASDLLKSGRTKAFYTVLSDIPRRYLEGRFGIPALDLTTAEILPQLKRRESLRGLFGEIRALLESCDLVKFAKYAPGPAEIERDIERVRSLIARTSPEGGTTP